MIASVLTASSAALTSGASASADTVSAVVAAAPLTRAIINASPNTAIVRVIMQDVHGNAIQTAGRSSNPTNDARARRLAPTQNPVRIRADDFGRCDAIAGTSIAHKRSV